jgi:hypothetical protein
MAIETEAAQARLSAEWLRPRVRTTDDIAGIHPKHEILSNLTGISGILIFIYNLIFHLHETHPLAAREGEQGQSAQYGLTQGAGI